MVVWSYILFFFSDVSNAAQMINVPRCGLWWLQGYVSWQRARQVHWWPQEKGHRGQAEIRVGQWAMVGHGRPWCSCWIAKRFQTHIDHILITYWSHIDHILITYWSHWVFERTRRSHSSWRMTSSQNWRDWFLARSCGEVIWEDTEFHGAHGVSKFSQYSQSHVLQIQFHLVSNW